jgi:hypothetical protein
MILEASTFEVAAGRDAQFEAAFAHARPLLLSARGHVHHELQRALPDGGSYLLLVHWRLDEPRSEAWRALLDPFLVCAPRIAHYRPVAGNGLPPSAAPLYLD